MPARESPGTKGAEGPTKAATKAADAAAPNAPNTTPNAPNTTPNAPNTTPNAPNTTPNATPNASNATPNTTPPNTTTPNATPNATPKSAAATGALNGPLHLGGIRKHGHRTRVICRGWVVVDRVIVKRVNDRLARHQLRGRRDRSEGNRVPGHGVRNRNLLSTLSRAERGAPERNRASRRSDLSTRHGS